MKYGESLDPAVQRRRPVALAPRADRVTTFAPPGGPGAVWENRFGAKSAGRDRFARCLLIP
jgi:hypothetical protein